MLLVVGIAALVSMSFVASLAFVSRDNLRASSGSYLRLQCEYAAHAAMQHAFAELNLKSDLNGDGIGAMGLVTPVRLFDASGQVLAEYRTVVAQSGDRAVITAVAAVPSFADPMMVSSVKSLYIAERETLFEAPPAAIALCGSVQDPLLTGLDAADRIDGGADAPAFVATDQGARDAVRSLLSDMISYDGLDPSTITGATNGQETLSVGHRRESALTSQALDEYRQGVTQQAKSLALSADRSITSPVIGDQLWGTALMPEVTVIDAGAIGADNVFGTDGQTITGVGTLIIIDAVRPGGNGARLNLNWTGDVILLGGETASTTVDPALELEPDKTLDLADTTTTDETALRTDGGTELEPILETDLEPVTAEPDAQALFHAYGTTANIEGNLVILSSDANDANVVLENSSSRPSSLRVAGSVMAVAESTARDASLSVAGSSSLHVDGLVGLYGSRARVSVASAGAFNVVGSLAMVLADKLSDSGSAGDLAIDASGSFSVQYAAGQVAASLKGIESLEAELNVAPTEATVAYGLLSVGSAGSTPSGEASAAAIDLLYQQNGAGYDYGLSLSEVATTFSTQQQAN